MRTRTIRWTTHAAWVGLLAAVSAFQVPPVIADPSHEVARRLSDTIGPVEFSTMAGMLLLGNKHTRVSGERALDSVAATGVLTEVLKTVVRARRPSDPSATSGFPSGHASSAFALATSLGDSYHNLRVPLYAWATAVGWSRNELGAHYWNQVAAGAVLGFAVARWSRSRKGGVFHGLFVSTDTAPHPSAMEGLVSPPADGLAVGWNWTR